MEAALTTGRKRIARCGGWLFVTFVTRPDMFCSKSQGNHTNVVTTTIHTQVKGIIIIIIIIIFPFCIGSLPAEHVL